MIAQGPTPHPPPGSPPVQPPDPSRPPPREEPPAPIPIPRRDPPPPPVVDPPRPAAMALLPSHRRRKPDAAVNFVLSCSNRWLESRTGLDHSLAGPSNRRALRAGVVAVLARARKCAACRAGGETSGHPWEAPAALAVHSPSGMAGCLGSDGWAIPRTISSYSRATASIRSRSLGSETDMAHHRARSASSRR
jgi:hypothetical protein